MSSNSDFITAGKSNSDAFGNIVLSHLQRILKLSIQEDNRESYIKSVEALGHLLMPYFDDEAKKVYQDFDKIINSQDGLKVLIKNNKIEFESLKILVLRKYCKDSFEYREHLKYFYRKKELQTAKELFQELNLLLRRCDYLRGSIYGNSLDEGIEADDK